MNTLSKPNQHSTDTESAWKIGDVAKRTGLSIRALHHYDQIRLVSPSRQHSSGHRWYTQADIVRLHTVVALRDLGMPLTDIGKVLD